MYGLKAAKDGEGEYQLPHNPRLFSIRKMIDLRRGSH